MGQENAYAAGKETLLKAACLGRKLERDPNIRTADRRPIRQSSHPNLSGCACSIGIKEQVA